MLCLETICMASFANVSFHQVFLSDHFKGLMLVKSSSFFYCLTLLYDGDQLQ